MPKRCATKSPLCCPFAIYDRANTEELEDVNLHKKQEIFLNPCHQMYKKKNFVDV